MESAKKIIPYILVAVVFAVGGYFVGVGNLSDQGASVYSGTNLKTSSQLRSSPTIPGSAGMVVTCSPVNFGNCTRQCTQYEDSGRVIGSSTQTGTAVYDGGRNFIGCQFLPTNSSGVQLPGGTVKANTATTTTKTQ